MSLNLDSLPEPKFRYSPAVRMGPFVQTAGMVGLERKSGALKPGGAEEEWRQILVNLRGLMSDNGLRHSDLMLATIYTTALHRMPALNGVWDEFLAQSEHLPARTTVGVSQLPLGAQVEAVFLFYRDATDKGARS